MWNCYPGPMYRPPRSSRAAFRYPNTMHTANDLFTFLERPRGAGIRKQIGRDKKLSSTNESLNDLVKY